MSAAEQTLFTESTVLVGSPLDIATKEIASIQQDPSRQILLAIADAARDPRCDPAKMRELVALQVEIDAQLTKREAEAARRAFNQAMIACNAEMVPVVKDAEVKGSGGGVQSRYARLATVEKKCAPIWRKHGFALSFSSEPGVNEAVTLVCIVLHEAGHSQEYRLSGALDLTGDKGAPNKTPIKALGSSTSYLRRYLVTMIFDLVFTDEDDDGEGTRRTINEDQRNQLMDLIVAQGEGAEKGLLRLMMVQRIEDILACNFEMAATQLKDRARRMQERR